MIEQIAYNPEHEADNGFYVSVKNLNNKEIGKKPLADWGLVRNLNCCLIVRRELPNFGNLESPSTPELFKVEITYNVNSNAKSLYLKKEIEQKDNDAQIIKLFVKDVNNGSCQQLPLPNAMYHDEFDISIKKSKGELITLKESVILLKSGNCLGIFDDSMTKKFII